MSSYGIEIFTLTLGGVREEYLLRCILTTHSAIIRLGGVDGGARHTVVFQGCSPSPQLLPALDAYQVSRIHLERNVGRALGQKLFVDQVGDCDIILRLDDDARLLETDFLIVMREVLEQVPTAFIHAFPIGLTGSIGGCRPRGPHRLLERAAGKGVFALRPVPRMGGLARAARRETWEKIPWVDDLGAGGSGIESAQLGRAAEAQSIPLYYVENGWAVEHQDSSAGQSARDMRPQVHGGAE